MPSCIKLFPWPAPAGGIHATTEYVMSINNINDVCIPKGESSEHSASADAPHPGVTPGVHVKENPGDQDKR